MKGEKSPLKELKKQQNLKVIAIVGGVAVVLFMLITLTSGKKEKKAVRPKPSLSLIKEDEISKESWIAKSGEQLQKTQKELEELKRTTEELKNELEKARKREEKEGKSKHPYPPPPPPPSPRTPPVIPSAPGRNAGTGQATSPVREGIEILEASDASPVAAGKEEEEKREVETSPSSYIPSGSFVKAVLLSGLDAPTGTKAKSQPHPVLLRVLDPAVIPNEFRFDVAGCFIVGEGYGDLASERAYIRTVSLSCVKSDGKAVLDTPLKGYVVGEDGKIGVRGDVVSKQGVLLARALVAGFLQGVSDAFAQTKITVNTTPLGGNVTTVKSEDALKYGAYSGAAKAMEQLAKYYIDLSNEVFPVIEVDAGRKVNVVVTNGQEVKFKEVSLK